MPENKKTDKKEHKFKKTVFSFVMSQSYTNFAPYYIGTLFPNR